MDNIDEELELVDEDQNWWSFVFLLRISLIILMFHQQVGFNLYLIFQILIYFFLATCYLSLILMTIAYCLYFYIIRFPKFHILLGKEQVNEVLDNLLSDSTESDPLHHYIIVPLIGLGILAMGCPKLALAFAVLYIVERIAYYEFSSLIKKIDAEN